MLINNVSDVYCQQLKAILEEPSFQIFDVYCFATSKFKDMAEYHTVNKKRHSEGLVGFKIRSGGAR